MSFLRESVINNTLNYIVLYKIIMRMITNIQDTKAYKLTSKLLYESFSSVKLCLKFAKI